jgi:uncharacterized protein involved in exopolysaccharide biosynthesis
LFLYTPSYTARQSLIVRDDLMGDSFKPSRFESLDSMKSAQETILEIARKPEVIRNVMEQMEESRSTFFGSGGISDKDIEEMQGNIEFGAPNGAEFGRTEAVVLKVTSATRNKAKDFTNLLLDEIDSKLSDVRRQRLKSMEQELALASESSKKSLDESSNQLQEIERGFGTEITTIRELNDPQGGNSFDLKLNQIRLEKREAVSTLASAREQRVLLENAQANESLVTSSQLLEMQPALSVMMGSLNTAREQLSIDEGLYKPLHPALKASREAVRHQKEMLFNSLGPTIVGVDSQIAMAEAKVERLNKSIVELEEKLLDLTEQRVPYAKLQEDVTNKTKVHSDVQAKLSQVRSYTNSSENIELLTRVGEPQVGSRPNGLGKKALVLVGLAGGLLIGLGLVALAVPPSGSTVGYQPVMMPMSGAQMVPTPSNPNQPRPRNPRQSTATAATPSAASVINETVSESRLKSHANQEQKRKQSDATPESASSLMTSTMGSAIPESVAKHMADLKSKAKAVLTPSAPAGQQAKAPASNERPKVSSEDVISAFKAAQTSPAGKAGPGTSATNLSQSASPTAIPKPEKTPSQTADSIQKQLRELDASEAKARQKQKQRALDPTIAQPDIVVVERKKTLAPEVPDSVAAGRITAESLIESSARRVQGQNPTETPSASNQPRQNIQSTPVDASILQQVKANLEDPINQTPKEAPSTRTPSISDYARSLEDAPTNRNTGELQDPSDSTLPMERRPSNVRPVDIAKSLAEHDSVRGIVDDIRPEESDSMSTQATNLRSTEATVPGKVLDNSLVGLMREARDSNPNVVRRKSNTDVGPADLKPTSKTSEKPPAAPQAKPKLEGNAESEAIPQQIKQLSDSISSFARPTNKSSEPKE